MTYARGYSWRKVLAAFAAGEFQGQRVIDRTRRLTGHASPEPLELVGQQVRLVVGGVVDVRLDGRDADPGVDVRPAVAELGGPLWIVVGRPRGISIVWPMLPWYIPYIGVKIGGQSSQPSSRSRKGIRPVRST